MTSAKSRADLRPLSPEEREKLLAALRSESDRIMLRLLLETGLPLDDLREARVSDLDRDRGLLRLKRRGERRSGGDEDRKGDDMGAMTIIPLSPELLTAVGDYIDKNPGKSYIFEGRCGKSVGQKWIRCTLLPAAIRIGLEDPSAETTDRK